ncbi:hypothetical protein J0X14_14155 [Muricauda sp. CAU 1633]|uniref:DUF5675 family protein n=1 Tax=Allomuricauda sp. CAU 1633 TaxID=2816036 RepID=UPI001A8DA8C0|nr:DUF5675 family protein [Muricauda sp. CAU 1633]MBO0323447.1 hypothetical protein [Muricauda sp. CAU 1633]
MVKGILIRHTHEDRQTLSNLFLFDGDGLDFSCKALELPDEGNERNVSRIPSGKYTCKKRTSDKYGQHYHVTDVDGRSLILIHAGNYYTQTRGCILVGQDYYDINNDGYMDVTSSKYTMRLLLDFAFDEFELTIIDL